MVKKYTITVLQENNCSTNKSKHCKEITPNVIPPLSCPVCGPVDPWRKPKLKRHSHLASCEAK
jgi:hypothetical protein